jgi:hypothetical protein
MKAEADSTFTSIKDGGWQIPFEDEDPAIHREFVSALEENGAECAMCGYFPGCPKRVSEAAAV